MTMCDCKGPGLEAMSTKDLIALRNTMEKAIFESEQAKSTLFAIRYELSKRADRMVETMNPNYHYEVVAYDGDNVS